MSRRETTSWGWQYAVRHHDGVIETVSDQYNEGRKNAYLRAQLLNEQRDKLRVDIPDAVAIRRKVTTTVVTTTQESAWEATP